MPSSRSAKEICREDPDSISCKVATNRERRRKKREEEYGEETPAPPAEEAKPEQEPEAPPPGRFERGRQLEELEKEAGSR